MGLERKKVSKKRDMTRGKSVEKKRLEKGKMSKRRDLREKSVEKGT